MTHASDSAPSPASNPYPHLLVTSDSSSLNPPHDPSLPKRPITSNRLTAAAPTQACSALPCSASKTAAKAEASGEWLPGAGTGAIHMSCRPATSVVPRCGRSARQSLSLSRTHVAQSARRSRHRWPREGLVRPTMARGGHTCLRKRNRRTHVFEDHKLYLASDPALLVLGRPSTLAHWRSEGRGPAFIKLGARVAYRGSDLNGWLAARTVRPTDSGSRRALVAGEGG